MRKSEYITLTLIALAFMVAAFFYPQMPARVAIHWNAQGQPDATVARFWGVFFIPLIMLGINALFLIASHLNPFNSLIDEVTAYYAGFTILFNLFLMLLLGLILLSNLPATSLA